MVRATFTKEKAGEHLWKPVLERHGYSDFQLEGGTMDLEEAVDATAKHETSGDDVLRIALRTRNVNRYRPQQLEQYKREFTIRWSRPTGALTESDKIFGEHRSDEDAPTLMGYGWVHPNGREIQDYVVLSVEVLRDLYDKGLLEACIEDAKRNTDWRQSTFVAISLQCVQDSSDGAAILYRNPNHPGLTDS